MPYKNKEIAKQKQHEYYLKIKGRPKWQMKKKKCIICGNEFETNLSFKKTCSHECWYKNNQNISIKRSKEREVVFCKDCKQPFVKLKNYKNHKMLCRKCINLKLKDRKGEKNPAYRNGFRSGQNRYNTAHSRANAKFKQCFILKHGYLFCESCGVSKSIRFETHHIMYASRFPKHKNLHHSKNQIMLCIQCHNDFHAEKRKSEANELIKRRGLNQLFNK